MKLYYNSIVLGSSLDAILFGAQNFFPVIFSDFQKPFRFETFEPKLNLDFLNISQDLWPKSLTTFGDEISVGMPKHLLWERFMFLLSAHGHVPLSNLCRSFRASDNKLTCFNEYSKIAEIEFENCYYFGDDNVHGLFEQKQLDNHKYLCYDWIAFNKGGKHDIDFFETDSDFVKRVWFYPSDRIDGNTAVKDACVLSILNTEQINDFDFSETMAKFKLISDMESRGMKGQFNGYGPNGNPKYYKFKTTHTKREKHVINEIKNFKVSGYQIGSIDSEKYYKNLRSIELGYDRFLRGLDEQPRTHSGHNTHS